MKLHQSVFKMSQMKLQQQKLHLGPPSSGLSLKRPDHLARASASESASQEALNKVHYPGQVIIMIDYNEVISHDQSRIFPCYVYVSTGNWVGSSVVFKCNYINQ